MKDTKKQLDRLDKQICGSFTIGITLATLTLFATIIGGIVRTCG